MTDKRALLIQTALKLFYEKGIHSVGINEILQVSGVAKKTLYNHFSSKEELVLATLQARDHDFLGWLRKNLEPARNDGEVIHILFESLNDWFNDKAQELLPFRGCFFINTAIENSELNQQISDYCKNHKELVRLLIKEKLQGDNDQLASAICLLKEGAIVTAYVSKKHNAALECIPLAMGLVKP